MLLLLGEFPCEAFGRVFAFGEEDVDGIALGIDPLDEGFDFVLRHGGAAEGGFGTAAAPDMEKDGGPAAGNDSGGVVVDEHFDGVRVIVLAHLGFLFPCGRGLAIEADVLVVVFRGDVFDPEVAGGDLAEGEVGIVRGGSIVGPGAAESEDAGRGATVAFFFQFGPGWHWTQSTAPSEPVGTEASFPWLGDELPRSLSIFLVAVKGDVRGVPAAGDADDGLGRIWGELEGVSG